MPKTVHKIPSPSCQTCVHFAPFDDPGWGKCFRYPPVPIPNTCRERGNQEDRLWFQVQPDVNNDCLCGEYKLKKEIRK